MWENTWFSRYGHYVLSAVPCKVLSNVEERLFEYFNGIKNRWPF